MAKKSMIAKQQRPAKFSTRSYNRCKICGVGVAMFFYNNRKDK